MESFTEFNNENNSCMLINPDNNNFNILLPISPSEIRNQRAKVENKTNNSTDDTKIKANLNLNSSYQKTFSLFNESNCDSNSQTDRSSNNLKEIKVNKTTKKQKNQLHNENNNLSFNNKLNFKEDKLQKIILIQKWWKKVYKIIFIQKYLRGFFIRKNMTNIIYFIKYSFKLLFKLMMKNIKLYIKESNININKIKALNNTDKKENKDKIKKNELNNKYPNQKKNKLNYFPSFNKSNIIGINKKIDELKKTGNKNYKNDIIKKFGNNNPINVNKSNNHIVSFKPSNKCLIKNKNNNNNNKINKNKKEQEKEKKEINNHANKDKLIANNIFNIYNNVKKYYEYENNNNSNYTDINFSTTNNFFKKNKNVNNNNNNNNNNNKTKLKKRGSMKNINEKIIINKNNNINLNINISNPKTDRSYRCDNSPKEKEINSILYLLKLKKAFLFWNSYITKKKIFQKLKIIKSIKTPDNIKKTLSIYTLKNKEENKSGSIKTKKINLSNSLINIKKNKIIPQKLNINMKNNNSKQNIWINKYEKKINKHSNSVENNNSMINLKPPKSALNCSFNIEKDSSLDNKNNAFLNNSFNNNVIVVSQYDRNNENKNKENIKTNNINNNNINDDKKIYYFYAIINLIDKHNKRKRIKKIFNIWKSLIRYSHSFINTYGIEEKIISFKSLRSPIKNNINENKSNKNNTVKFNCQTEAGVDEHFSQDKLNPIYIQKDLFTPNPLEKSIHPNLFKSNIKSSKIIYQKKLLVPKKMRNQSMNTIHTNEEDEYRNMTLADNNKEFNYFNQTIGNTYYNMNTYMNNNNSFNNSNYINSKNNFDKNIGNIQEGRINRLTVNGIEETEIVFTPNQSQTLKNSFIVGKNNSKDDDGFNPKKINVNVVENYRKIDLNKDNIINNRTNRLKMNNEKSQITTKKINLLDKNKKNKNYSHSQESIRNDNEIL